MSTPLLKTKEITVLSLLDVANLKSHTHWIRDTLDTHIARDGPESISIEDALYLDQFLRKLLLVTISVQDIRTSRIHLALLDIAGRATRWPHRLVERAEALIKAWEANIGKLSHIGIELVGPGGRLEGIATVPDIASDRLFMTWLKQGDKLLPMRARRWGDLGFKPGEYDASPAWSVTVLISSHSWWINSLFAFRDGIIDSASPDGGISCDSGGSYAIMLSEHDEIVSPSAETFTYRCRIQDKGRYRLTSAIREARHPIRVLRSHALRSFWSPRVGVRYDGLYRIAGWSVHHDKVSRAISYDVSFERLKSESPMEAVLARPYIDEIEDYKEFKCLRHANETGPLKISKLEKMGIPTFLLTTDGTAETPNDSIAGDREDSVEQDTRIDSVLPATSGRPML